MKNVTVTSEKLKRDGYDSIDLDGRALPLGSEVRLTEAEYEKLQARQSAWEEQFNATVDVGDAEAESAPAEPDPSDAPSPDPSGTTKSRNR